MHADAPDQHIEQVAPVRRIRAEHDLGVRKHLEGAAVGNAERGPAIRTADDHLFRADGIAHVQRPGLRVVEDRDISRKRDDFRGPVAAEIGDGRRGLRHAHGDCGCAQQQKPRQCSDRNSHKVIPSLDRCDGRKHTRINVVDHKSTIKHAKQKEIRCQCPHNILVGWLRFRLHRAAKWPKSCDKTAAPAASGLFVRY